MSKRLYVGNLPFLVNDDDLKGIFSSLGEVLSAQVVMDKRTGRSKGYGFVEMQNEAIALQAIETYNGGEIDGRTLKVTEAKSEGPKAATPAVADTSAATTSSEISGETSGETPAESAANPS